MKKYIVYNTDTGYIVSSGQCTDKVFHLQARKNELVIEGAADDRTHKINLVTRQVIKKETSELPKPRVARQQALEGENPAIVTNDQLESILIRLNALENRY